MFIFLDKRFLPAAPCLSGAGDVRQEHHGARAPDLLLRSFLEASFLKMTMLSLLILVRPFPPLGWFRWCPQLALFGRAYSR